MDGFATIVLNANWFWNLWDARRINSDGESAL
jgi:hypothetical protein